MSETPPPGVFISEQNAFPNSIVPVPTSIPVFLGYTEKVTDADKDIKHQAIRITSLTEFIQKFGGPPTTSFNLSSADVDPGFVLTISSNPHLLFYSVKFFYENGGGDCYILSIGDYDTPFNKTDLIGDIGDSSPRGLKALSGVTDPSIVLIPDAVLFERSDCSEIQNAMLRLCEEEGRFAILDVQDGHLDAQSQSSEENIIEQFRNGIGIDGLSHAAAYYPWLESTVIPPEQINFKNIDSSSIPDLIQLLHQKTKEGNAAKSEIDKLSQVDTETKILHKILLAGIPLYKEIISAIAKKINLLPPSGAMAGIYARVDSQVGVHQSPANVSIISVIKPAVDIDNNAQEDLNVPLNGKAVNAIRSFPGKGNLVWGARTLNGNSLDWRYISVRRLIIMIEQSIKLGLRSVVFEPNDANTWATAKSMIESFLNSLWQEGALAGSTPEDAFNVQIGLGSTMTPQDILEGFMRCTVMLAVTRPAEFIVLTFEQEMAKS